MGGNAMCAGGGGEGAILDRSSAGTGWGFMLQSKKWVRRKETMEPMGDNWCERRRGEGSRYRPGSRRRSISRDCLRRLALRRSRSLAPGGWRDYGVEERR